MNSLHRQFGRLTHKGAGDKASVSVLLNDYEDADKVLTKVCELAGAQGACEGRQARPRDQTLSRFESLTTPADSTDRERPRRRRTDRCWR